MRVDKKYILLSCMAAMLCISAQGAAQTATPTPTPATACNDGKDNDGDGLIDAYVDLSVTNGETFTLGGANTPGDPSRVLSVIRSTITSKKFNLTLPTVPFVRSDGGTWAISGSDQGTGITLHQPTLDQLCRILGYRTVVGSTCRDAERSGLYPSGKCNYNSPTDNSMHRYVGTNFTVESADPKYQKTWVASITCKDRLSACSDGWDNDGDGKIDLADNGCRTANDDSELPDDPKCTSLTGATESEQCRNGTDDDGDGLADVADPGCWTDKVNASTYNPALDDESRATTACQDGIDNDGDGASDLADFSCQGDKKKNDEASPKSQCQDGVDNDGDGAVDVADFSCQNNKQANDEASPKSQCQDGVDNDGDGAVDLADFSCQNNKQANDEASPKSQCQDGVDNDGDGAVDLADFSCQNSKQANDETNPKAACQDGSDNDKDGATDLVDPGCSGAQDTDESGEPMTLSVSGACVLDNQDNTFTAYFSYDNMSGKEVEVVSDPAKGTRNEFSPGAANRGQLTKFAAGKVQGAVAVPFDGSALTWTVRAPGSAVSSVTVTKASTACKALEPMAECYDGVAGAAQVTFGYSNPNGFAVSLPVGALNSFSPAPANAGQPTQFANGTIKGAFRVPYRDGLTWNLYGRAASVTKATPICPGGCVESGTITIKSELNQAALALASLTKEAAARLAKNPGKRQDAKRAAKRAEALAAEAARLTLSIPDVSVSCPFTSPVCETIDRGATIDAIRALYGQQFSQLKRIVARAYFNQSGATKRGDTMVNFGARIRTDGEGKLAQVPRLATDCS